MRRLCVQTKIRTKYPSCGATRSTFLSFRSIPPVLNKLKHRHFFNLILFDHKLSSRNFWTHSSARTRCLSLFALGLLLFVPPARRWWPLRPRCSRPERWRLQAWCPKHPGCLAQKKLRNEIIYIWNCMAFEKNMTWSSARAFHTIKKNLGKSTGSVFTPLVISIPKHP